ncbi:MAG: DUF2075 domain-containing protein [Sedimentisphaerales bacterium]|nr:DUF2075 domain-containing protein [Sedimentisphaerales bacterium]
MPAYYSDFVLNFLKEDMDAIIGKLSKRIGAEYDQTRGRLIESWKNQIIILRETLGKMDRGEISSWYILYEFPIPRRGKRIDIVVLARDIIIVIELKDGGSVYHKADRDQVEDYCLDLRDFHEPSYKRVIVPILLATDAQDYVPVPDENDYVKLVHCTNRDCLQQALESIYQKYRCPELKDIDGVYWNNGNYQPTPTIIEAAQSLYAGQNVREITRSHAGAENLTKTTNAVLEAIRQAKQANKKLICFITGVPGSGKTLAGLNIVHNHDLHDGDLGVFLSGNGPLVKVLQEALARDNANQNKVTLKEARRKVTTFVHNVHLFIDDNFGEHPEQYQDKIPADKVLIFDEAQRAWDAKQSKKKWNRNYAEAEMLLTIMDRHPGWAVIIALIGGGQEINSGEAGLEQWGKTIKEKFRHWQVMVSPKLQKGDHSTGGMVLFKKKPDDVTIIESELLHLDVAIRSYKAESLSKYVGLLLDVECDLAREVYETKLNDYPFFMTRSLENAKRWLVKKQRGLRRSGITASSGARRLRAYGLDVQFELEVPKWFLNASSDVRSSCFLELPATEFGVQGLELDFTCVCWGGDFRFDDNGWQYRIFKGTKWQNVNDDVIQQYIKNKYRVLLTRAREGIVIWVPEGDYKDDTRLPEFYNGVAEYLKKCGIREITSV